MDKNTIKIQFEEFKDEIDSLIEFLTSDVWEFHGTPNPIPERIRMSYENHFLLGMGAKHFG